MQQKKLTIAVQCMITTDHMEFLKPSDLVSVSIVLQSDSGHFIVSSDRHLLAVVNEVIYLVSIFDNYKSHLNSYLQIKLKGDDGSITEYDHHLFDTKDDKGVLKFYPLNYTIQAHLQENTQILVTNTVNTLIFREILYSELIITKVLQKINDITNYIISSVMHAF